MSMFRNSLRSALTTFETLADLEQDLLRAAGLVRTCLLGGGKLLVAGNGGSAADGMDFSTEFTCRFSGDRRPYPAINLATDGTLLAAIGNDYAFDEVFARQVWAFGKLGDVLVVYSTSGKSPNILRALDEAKARGLESIAFLGRDGGPDRARGDYGPHPGGAQIPRALHLRAGGRGFEERMKAGGVSHLQKGAVESDGGNLTSQPLTALLHRAWTPPLTKKSSPPSPSSWGRSSALFSMSASTGCRSIFR
jgi:D-sedoheptulose 7-phosphate isomerase